jgi:hypothetical protein
MECAHAARVRLLLVSRKLISRFHVDQTLRTLLNDLLLFWLLHSSQLLLVLPELLLAILRCSETCFAPAAELLLYAESNTSRSSVKNMVEAESAKLTMGNFMASLCVMLSCGGSALTDLQLPTYTVSAACSTTLKLQTPHKQQEWLDEDLQAARTPGRNKQYTAAVCCMVSIRQPAAVHVCLALNIGMWTTARSCFGTVQRPRSRCMLALLLLLQANRQASSFGCMQP